MHKSIKVFAALSLCLLAAGCDGNFNIPSLGEISTSADTTSSAITSEVTVAAPSSVSNDSNQSSGNNTAAQTPKKTTSKSTTKQNNLTPPAGNASNSNTGHSSKEREINTFVRPTTVDMRNVPRK